MAQQGVITGRIIDSNGEPVKGATVLALSSRFGPDGRELLRSGTTSTDEKGQYRLAELIPGNYFLRASNPDINRSAVATYYPNTTDILAAAAIHVSSGAEARGTDIQIATGRAYSLRGKAILAVTGAPAGGFTLTAMHHEGNSSRAYTSQLETHTHSDGTFEFIGLPPGQCTLQVLPTRIATPPVTVSALTEVTIATANADDVQVLLRSGVALTGNVKLEGGDMKSLIPAESARGPGTREEADARMREIVAARADGILEANSRPYVNLGAGHIGQFQEDGTFNKIADLPPSRYYLNALLPVGIYVKSATFGGIDALHAPLDMTQAGGELNLVLSNKAADLAGSLRNEKGELLGNAPISLWPSAAQLGSATRGVQFTVSDQNGSFHFLNLRPGQYYVAAWEDDSGGFVTNHEVLSLFNSAATAVTLAESEHVMINPKIIPAETVAVEIAKLP
jgi:protocatechuate 3,4-dioxygenase beta subunit